MKKGLLTFSLIVFVMLLIIQIQNFFPDPQEKHQYLKNMDSSDHPLIQAVINNDGIKIQSILENGFDVNKKGKDGETALHIAAVLGNKDIVDLLIKAGCDLNSQSNFCGYTPLMIATINSNWLVVETLIYSGADESIKNCKSGTAYGYSDDKKRFRMILEAYEKKKSIK